MDFNKANTWLRFFANCGTPISDFSETLGATAGLSEEADCAAANRQMKIKFAI